MYGLTAVLGIMIKLNLWRRARLPHNHTVWHVPFIQHRREAAHKLVFRRNVKGPHCAWV